MQRREDIFHRDAHVVVRSICGSDPDFFARQERAQGWHATPEKLLRRLSDHREGRAVTLVAVYDGEPAGYGSVYPDAQEGPFAGKGFCEIVDLAVLERFRRRGIGNLLLDVAEGIAFTYADTVYLAVGLHSGYGSAQRIYVRRGYLPHDSGAWYAGSPAQPYQGYPLDDNLVLYLSKTFSQGTPVKNR